MKESTIGIDLTEEEILIYEASDEALEAAACGMKMCHRGAGPTSRTIY